ncbi:Uracil phosphoribosyltransferase [Candidatus Bealeia paramacronuclearis]|uniref:Uracil phosphoribosyltransferase n=1 Tax=Candidatus Bealeia paramacronuclearis TaxID=1921001 RepID=A0ABZ2C1W5_9PROT|nr:Uracil phosphoribosyltransferase [Candidatus Bealeia paramacronuclearis]
MIHNFPNLRIIKHPLIQHKLTQMRKKETNKKDFRTLLREISLLMGYEITRDMPIREIEIETPLMSMKAPTIAGEMVAIVPILRAGLGMADGLLELMPTAYEGHIGLYRDPETKKPVEYLVKLPFVDDRMFILVDPMLATGNSAVYAIDILVRHGVALEKIKFLALVAAPEGIETFNKSYPTIPIYAAALDDCLNAKAYIEPGLGDAGDRLFGTY